MKNIVCFLVMALLSEIAFAQKSRLVIHFNHIANGKKIVQTDSAYENAFGENYTINQLKYYVSNVTVISGSEKFKSSKARLIDAFDRDSLMFNAPTMKYDTLKFTIGVDSLANVSGTQKGDLDPLKGMYWTWNTGYINFKIEGISESATNQHKKYEYHLGGYKPGENASVEVVIVKPFIVIGAVTNLEIIVDIDKFWKQSIASESTVNSPGKATMEAAKQLSAMFELKSVK